MNAMILLAKCNYIKGAVNPILHVVDMRVLLYFDWNLNSEILDVFKKIELYRTDVYIFCIVYQAHLME